MKNEIKIQINSREALDRLIGDDPELKIAIQKAVLFNYQKQHIKPLVTEHVNEEMLKKVLDEIMEDGNSWNTKLNNRSKEMVKEQAKNNIHSLVSEVIDEQLKSKNEEFIQEIEGDLVYRLSDMINKNVTARLASYIDKHLDTEIKRVASEIVAKGIQNYGGK